MAGDFLPPNYQADGPSRAMRLPLIGWLVVVVVVVVIVCVAAIGMVIPPFTYR